MPSALLRACAYPGGCPELTEGHLCTAHQKERESRRGSAHARGYTRHWRQVFIPLFERMLIAAGLAPVCGAALPDGPRMTESRCNSLGVLTFFNQDGSRLHLHHNPPLQEHERDDRQAVEDPRRVGFLCQSCHAAETLASQQMGHGG